ncbi:MAG: L,D-transpeptidase family protein [Desulfobacterales bacterium]|nr:L,D-transpeptidase family protein [Desulfobacterales bacterium]
MKKSFCLFGGLIGLCLWCAWGWADDQAVARSILSRVDLLRNRENLVIAGHPIASRHVLPQLYERRAHAPLWSRTTTDQLLAAIDRSREEGLTPEDYHRSGLLESAAWLRRGADDPERRAEVDILATDAFIRLAYNLFFGKADPHELDPDWNTLRQLQGVDPVGFLSAAIDLAAYRAIAARGGWPKVPPGPTLRAGMRDARVEILRQRLAATGDLTEPGGDPALFDDALEEAVKAFQKRHRMAADGAVGPATLAALQVPVQARIDQIRVNLERARWMLHHVPQTFVIVDIAGFEAGYLREGKLVWRSRVQVGKPYRSTPIFRSDISYLVLNPTWTVPPGIEARDILPAVQRNRGYLAAKNLRIIDPQGRTIDPAQIDWKRYSGRNFPYTFRQDPGADNALGQIKFMFPNPHFVYLHDTPSRDLFERDVRAFSSGCIRVERPLELAELLLNDPDKWSLERIRSAIDTQRTQTVTLPEPVPVLLYYWTAQGQADGSVHFKTDIYRRDPAVLKALDGEFKFRRQPVTKDRGY